MAVNKVVFNTADGEQTLIDLTGDSVTPETLAEGVTAHDASGARIVGTMQAGSGGGTGDTGSQCNSHMCIFKNGLPLTPDDAELFHVVRDGNHFTITYSGTDHEFIGYEVCEVTKKASSVSIESYEEGVHFDLLDTDDYSYFTLVVYPEETNNCAVIFNAIV